MPNNMALAIDAGFDKDAEIARLKASHAELLEALKLSLSDDPDDHSLDRALEIDEIITRAEAIGKQ